MSSMTEEVSILKKEAEKYIGTSKHETVDDLLNFFHKSAELSNLSDYIGCFHPDSVFLGTDSKEHWHIADFYQYSKPYFLAKQGWKYTLIENSRKVKYFHKNTPHQFCCFDELLESDEFCTSRGTGTLIYDSHNKKWLVASYHLSFPVPNELAQGICKCISEFEAGLKKRDAYVTLLTEFESMSTENQKNDPMNKDAKKKKKKKASK